MTAVTAGSAPTRKRLSPRKRAQRMRIVQYAVLVVLVLLAVLTIDGRAVQQVFFRPDLIARTISPALGIAFLNTIIYTVGAFLFGLLLGTILALMKLSQVAPYRWLAKSKSTPLSLMAASAVPASTALAVPGRSSKIFTS